ncbi:MAG TPA: Fe-S cluster assembly protein SufD [Candidatus Aquilonibacter sp.]|nr:Fe-S cluster assembly protein SufD [Candidatus Aquilonibacter sp.]
MPTQELTTYQQGFGGFEKSAAGNRLAWLRSMRRDAFARFSEVGIPTTRMEDWRFTNLSSLAQTPFRLARDGRIGIAPKSLDRFSIPGSACQLVFVNGRYAPEHSNLGKLPDGVEISNLAAEIESQPSALEAWLGRYLDTRRDPFSALNTAFLEDGAFIHIEKGVVLEAPIHLLFVSISESGPTMTHPRNLIVAEDESQATFVEDYVSLPSQPGVEGRLFCNTATELIAGDNAVISHYMIEREHTDAFNVSTLRIEQGRDANVASHSVLLGGGIVRNNVHPVLNGEGGDCLINGLFAGTGRQHLDNYMLVEHVKPHCGSRQFYNGILGGHAHGVFHGRIIVHKDAQKTDAKQTNRNLLLSDGAQIDTKPQLEIYADDVKCTHGATIGQIEENSLFYLRSRGIDEASARQLLLLAFASECLDRMAEGPARTHVEALIHEHLTHLIRASANGKASEAAG